MSIEKQHTFIQQKDENNQTTNKEIFSIEPIEGTPFASIQAEKGHAVVIGNQVISDWCETKEKAIAYLDNNKWDVIMTLTLIGAERYLQYKQRENN